jgi:hypothetical protein
MVFEAHPLNTLEEGDTRLKKIAVEDNDIRAHTLFASQVFTPTMQYQHQRLENRCRIVISKALTENFGINA